MLGEAASIMRKLRPVCAYIREDCYNDTPPASGRGRRKTPRIDAPSGAILCASRDARRDEGARGRAELLIALAFALGQKP